MLPRLLREERLLNAVAVGFADRDLVGRACSEHAEILRQDDKARPCRCRLGDQRARDVEIGGDVSPGNHLDCRNAKRRASSRRDAFERGLAPAAARRHRVIPSPFGPGIAAAVAVPSRVTTGSAHPPVTRYL